MLKKLYFLIGLFVFSILIMVATIWLGLNKLSGLADELSLRGNDSVQITDASFTGAELYQIIADSVIINNNLTQSGKDWQEGKNVAAKQWKTIERIVDTDEEKQLLKAAVLAYDDFVNIYETEMLPLLNVKDGNGAAITATDDKLDAKVQALADDLNEIKASLANEVLEAHANMESTSNTIITVLVIVGVFILAIVGLIGFNIARNVMRQLGGDPDYITGVVHQIAGGDLSTTIVVKPGDTTSLIASMKVMQDAINNFVSAQGVMAQKHAEGWINEHMDASHFPGTDGKMAKEINELVATHVAVKMQVVEIVGQYAKGDFSRDIDRLPAAIRPR